jgi:Ca2+-binding EF-hand superfamily protein
MRRLPLALLGVVTSAVAAADDPAERYAKAVRAEDETARKLVERIQKPGDSERERWYKRLDEVFTNRVPDDPTYWYDLVTGGRGEWHRDTSKFFAEFHERVCQRLELKKADPVSRDAFATYARRYLGPDSPPWRAVDVDEEARGPFKHLDLDRDGSLSRAECSPGLADRFDLADGNGDGKVDLAEYRAYFRTRVGYEVQTAGPPDDRQKEERKREEERANGVEAEEARPTAYSDPAKWPKEVPGWFRRYDEDRDNQVGLYEWKGAKRPLSEFQAMDLNADGLLEVAELLRYLRQKGPDPVGQADLRAGKR